MNYYERRQKRLQEEERKTQRMRKSSNRASLLVCAAGIVVILLMNFCAPVSSVGDSSSAAKLLSSSAVYRESQQDRNAEAQKALISDWRLILVNRQHPLPENFKVSLFQRKDGFRVDSRTEKQLEQMLAAAKADGVELRLNSAFRSMSEQDSLYRSQMSNSSGFVQPAGYSEYHTGLAVDFVTPSHLTLDSSFAKTAAFTWLSQHSWQYGYILRDPKEKEAVTGVPFEPWHFRYVGREYAEDMIRKGICLEEYRRSLGI